MTINQDSSKLPIIEQQTVSENNVYEVAIIGGGISGTALLYSLSNYTNINRIVLIEKHKEVALLNSHKNSNSQTLHFGDIETNYTLEKAQIVNSAANLVKNYILKNDPQQKTYSKYHKMVLGIGEKQVEELRQRYQQFKGLFPKLRLIEQEEIEVFEPNVVKNRAPNEEIIALFTEEGYTIDFQKLAQSFLTKSLEYSKNSVNLMMETKVDKVEREGDLYHIQTTKGAIAAKVVVFTTGAYSLLFAKSLGYGKDYALLDVAGNFYLAPGVLNGKVYTVQLKKIPFAAIHGDSEVHDSSKTRFGPTAKVTLLLEKRNYASVFDYLRTSGISINAFISFFNILSEKVIWQYILKNYLYDIPLIGKRLFLKEARKVVPSLQLSDLRLAKEYGGIRPQIVNLKTKRLELGEAKIVGKDILFNITPSPGASTCLQNAFDDTAKIISFLGQEFSFNEYQFLEDLKDE